MKRRLIGHAILSAAAGVTMLVACSSATDRDTSVASADGSTIVNDDAGPSATVDAAYEIDAAQPNGTVTDAGSDAADGAASEESDSGSTEEDSGSEIVDSGPNYCDGFVRYAIPAGSYAWGHRCSGFQLSTSVADPPTQTECQFVGYTLDSKCVKWRADTASLIVYFKQSSAPGQDCDIQLFAILDGGDTHSCP